MTLFSGRTHWPGGANAVENALAPARQHKDFIDLMESNPTLCRFSFHKAGLLSELTHPENLYYRPDSKGLREARVSVQTHYASRGINIDPEQIFLVASTSEAYTYVLKLMADAGDRILSPKPSYPLFEYLFRLCDVRMENYGLIYDEAWHIDRESIREKCPDAKGIVFVHPNNPTGHYVSPEEHQELEKVVRDRKDFFIVSDEVFWDFAFAPKNPLWSFAGKNNRLTFTLSGISKILGLPQMKLSWIVVTGPKDLREEAIRRLEIIADTYLSLSTPIAKALDGWLRMADDVISEMRARVQKNYEWLSREWQGSGLDMLSCEGGWYAVLNIPDGRNDEDVALCLLEQGHVYVHPGYYYDFSETNRLLVSLLLPEEIFQKGIRRVIKIQR